MIDTRSHDEKQRDKINLLERKVERLINKNKALSDFKNKVQEIIHDDDDEGVFDKLFQLFN